jgi:hypothetical protein
MAAVSAATKCTRMSLEEINLRLITISAILHRIKGNDIEVVWATAYLDPASNTLQKASQKIL